MYLVKQLTRLLELSVAKKIQRAENRNTQAMNAFKKSKVNMQRSQNELHMAKAETLIQLKKLDDTKQNIIQKAALNDRRMKAIDTVIDAE
jgi:hypothetical protein